MPVVPSLSALPSHSIFIPPKETGTKEQISLADDNLEIPLKCNKIALRDKDIIVAHGSEIRITNISNEDWEEHDGQLGHYKVCSMVCSMVLCTLKTNDRRSLEKI